MDLAKYLIGIALCVWAASACAGDSAVQIHLPKEPFPAVPGYHVLKATAVVDGKPAPIAYGVFLPPAYFKSSESFPVVVTLHTRGNSGSDGNEGLAGEGLAMLLAHGGPDSRAQGRRPETPMHLPVDAGFIGLVPQCPAGHGWDQQPVPDILVELIHQVARAGRGDEDRVYLTGFSYGGSSTWRIAMQHPDRFAAIVPLDARATEHPREDVKKLANVAVFLGVGDADEEFVPEARRMQEALSAARHPRFVYRSIPQGNHWCYGSVYTDPQFWTWLFAQRRQAIGTADVDLK